MSFVRRVDVAHLFPQTRPTMFGLGLEPSPAKSHWIGCQVFTGSAVGRGGGSDTTRQFETVLITSLRGWSPRHAKGLNKRAA